MNNEINTLFHFLGSNIHLEAQVNPVSDHTMNIEWFKDGKPITASSRIGTLYSFGYVSLNITGININKYSFTFLV